MKQLLNAMNNNESIKDLAEERNSKAVIYCTECCTSFTKRSDGQWKSNSKVAKVIRGRMLKCTCGETLGFIAPHILLPGEVFGMDRA